MVGKWIELFKTGKQTDSAGNTREWTEQDLDAIVAKYNGGDHEAPIVVGHPESNSPAFGWVECLKREGKLLYARLKEVMPEFEELVKAGTYKKRSISLYPDLTLRHIGFLGGMPPAVKGLANVFNEVDTQDLASVLTYEFSAQAEPGILDRIKNFLNDLTSQTGQINTDTSFNDPKEESMKPEEVQELVTKAVAAVTQQFGETIKGLETQLVELNKGFAAGREEGLRREFREFLMTPEMRTRVSKGSREATINHMMTLVDAAPVMFEEGGERKTVPAVDDYKKQLKALPEVVSFGEFATKDKAGDVTSVGGMDIDAVADKAREFVEAEGKAGRTVSFTGAVSHVKSTLKGGNA